MSSGSVCEGFVRGERRVASFKVHLLSYASSVMRPKLGLRSTIIADHGHDIRSHPRGCVDRRHLTSPTKPRAMRVPIY